MLLCWMQEPPPSATRGQLCAQYARNAPVVLAAMLRTDALRQEGMSTHAAQPQSATCRRLCHKLW
jgi:hypothetical protein